MEDNTSEKRVKEKKPQEKRQHAHHKVHPVPTPPPPALPHIAEEDEEEDKKLQEREMKKVREIQQKKSHVPPSVLMPPPPQPPPPRSRQHPHHPHTHPHLPHLGGEEEEDRGAARMKMMREIQQRRVLEGEVQNLKEKSSHTSLTCKLEEEASTEASGSDVHQTVHTISTDEEDEVTPQQEKLEGKRKLYKDYGKSKKRRHEKDSSPSTSKKEDERSNNSSPPPTSVNEDERSRIYVHSTKHHTGRHKLQLSLVCELFYTPISERDYVILNPSTIVLFRYKKERIKFLIGEKFSTINSMRRAFSVDIQVPDQLSTHEFIVVIGHDTNDLVKCIGEIVHIIY